MKNTTYRTCPECGTATKNSDICKNCGAIINITLRRKAKRDAANKLKKAHKTKDQSSITEFIEKAVNHENRFKRYIARFFFSIWFLVLGVFGVLALITVYIAA
ncbi:hypothetical protein [Aquimarina agarivorans]|uniref:hypothetical protein n=1 Tax=Aquimarina agarivorans TaxID=980584 RepID=UPI000248E69C|nr:hypothetical protein [Aquimarina agarivorans]